MSSYGNHVWTQDRESAAHKLVQAAMDCDDDGFAEILHGIANNGDDLLAVTALLAEQLAEYAEREIEAI
jgi:hypothetical protein